MLTQTRIQTYRSWEDSGEMPLAPLTGLFGKNGTGKSAILQWLRQQVPLAIYLSPWRVVPAGTNNVSQTQIEMPLISEALWKLGLIHEAKDLESPSTGVLQALPLLQACYTAPPESLILIENPENNLHPSSQTALADIFIEAVTTRQVQIIFESHSEAILHRIGRRIAEEQLPSTAVAYYACERGANGLSTLIPLKINEYGGVTNWPKDFFKEVINELVAASLAETNRLVAEEERTIRQKLAA